MGIKKAEFVESNSDDRKCIKTDLNEYAFIGRSNVGKSTLINYITNNNKLAKTSSRPGKTQLINHFLIDDTWYLVDLPGYGYAKVSKDARKKFSTLISNYILNRENLINLFVLIDSRLPPQKIDLEFIEWLGENGLPFSIVFTKSDKIGSGTLQKNIAHFKKELLKSWEELPQTFITSSTDKLGGDEIVAYIEQINIDVAENNS